MQQIRFNEINLKLRWDPRKENAWSPAEIHAGTMKIDILSRAGTGQLNVRILTSWY